MVREGEAEKGPRVLRNRDADFLSTAEMQEEQEAPVPHAFQGKKEQRLAWQCSVPRRVSLLMPGTCTPRGWEGPGCTGSKACTDN